jgi:hypothetical protein
LQASLTKAGIDLSDADLEQFIKAMDMNGDGVIDYEEWRDFLVVSQCPIALFFVSVFCFCCTLCLSRRSFSLSFFLSCFYFVAASLSTMDTRLYAGRGILSQGPRKIETGPLGARIQDKQEKKKKESAREREGIRERMQY